jgi:threonine aldolase
MLNFKNDYCNLCHKEVFEYLQKYQNETFVGYGTDEITKKAKELIKETFKLENADIHFLIGGTSTNKIMIAHALKPYEAVISATSGHINVHETGAIEETGHKILTVPEYMGKIKAEDIEKIYIAHTDEHMVKPKMVYISNSTEYGTVYTYDELKSLKEVCEKLNLYLYMDGARLGVALTSKYTDLKKEDLKDLVDAFYIGGTKNGVMIGEALVILNDELKKEFRYSIKHYGGMLAKGFLIGLEYIALFENNLYFDIAKQQNELSELLVEKLKEENTQFIMETESNQNFITLNNETVEKLKENVYFEIWEPGTNKTSIRLVTHYMLTKDDILNVVKLIKEAK